MSDSVFAKDDVTTREIVSSKNGSTYETQSGGMIYVASKPDRDSQQTTKTGEQQRINETYQPHAQSEQNATARERNERITRVERKVGREMI